MIDLHTHTHYSDGTDTVVELLKHAEEKGLTYLAITDHNTAKAYEEIETFNFKDYFSGNIICGIELNTKILNIPIEILGYGIDYKIMNELVKDVYIDSKERNKIELSRLVDKCRKAGIKIDQNYIDSYDASDFASKFIHKAIIRDEENRKYIDEDAWDDSKGFYRKYMSNPKTPFYVEMDDFVPDFETAANLVRKSGGMVFIPHIFEYRDNSLPILEDILKNHEIDGIECYYTTFTEEQKEYVLNVCKERNLYVSGGSDYHGKNKPGVEVGTGLGNLKVPDEILEWIKTGKDLKILT